MKYNTISLRELYFKKKLCKVLSKAYRCSDNRYLDSITTTDLYEKLSTTRDYILISGRLYEAMWWSLLLNISRLRLSSQLVRVWFEFVSTGIKRAPLRLVTRAIDSISRRLCSDVKYSRRFIRVGCYDLPDSCLELTNLSWAEKYVRGIGQVVSDYVSGYRPYMARGIWGLMLLLQSFVRRLKSTPRHGQCTSNLTRFSRG